MNRYFYVWLLLTLPLLADFADADTLFESGTLGPTGLTWNDHLAEGVGGTNIERIAFIGVRFEITQPVVTTHIGGHFLQRSEENPQGDGSFFGAIVTLDNENEFPDSGDLSTPDVLGSTLLTFPDPSDEVLGVLSLRLDPGWYALVFGSGLFDSSAGGVALRNNSDFGSAMYIGRYVGSWQVGDGWLDLSTLSTSAIFGGFRGHRFVVLGSVVPEPTSIGLIAAALLCAMEIRHPAVIESR